MRPAVFIDRDGTLIEHVHYLSNPEEVALLPGAAEAIIRLQAAGFACVIVTNQSAIGRGMLTVDRLGEIHNALADHLARDGARLDGVYYCPIEPKERNQRIIEHPDRKPGPGMLQQAARDLSLDLANSWMVGDSLSDVLAGRNAGCRGCILVRSGYGERHLHETDAFDHVATDFGDAATIILEHLQSGTPNTADGATQPSGRTTE